jgi:hypothetical protein
VQMHVQDQGQHNGADTAVAGVQTGRLLQSMLGYDDDGDDQGEYPGQPTCGDQQELVIQEQQAETQDSEHLLQQALASTQHHDHHSLCWPAGVSMQEGAGVAAELQGPGSFHMSVAVLQPAPSPMPLPQLPPWAALQGAAAASHEAAQLSMYQEEGEGNEQEGESMQSIQGQGMHPPHAQFAGAPVIHAAQEHGAHPPNDPQFAGAPTYMHAAQDQWTHPESGPQPLLEAAVMPGSILQSMSASLNSLAARMQQLTGRAGQARVSRASIQ